MDKNLTESLPYHLTVDKALKKQVHELPTLPIVALKLLKLPSEDNAMG